MYCSNHRTELAIKTVFEERIFKEFEDLYVGIFYFHKNSGQVLKVVRETCKKSYKFFQKVIRLLNILDCIVPVSLVFEGEGLLAFEVARFLQN